MVFIFLWVIYQLVLRDGSIRGGVTPLGVLAMGLVIGGAVRSPSMILFHVKAAFLVPLFFMAAFYLGAWGSWGTSEQSTFIGFNTNQMSSILLVGVLIGAWMTWRASGPWKILLLVLVLLFIPAMWATGSRKWMAFLMVFPLIQLTLLNRQKLLMWTILGSFGLMIGLVAVGPIYRQLASNELFKTRTATFESSRDVQILLIERGVQAGRLKTWTGHGLDAPFSEAWLIRYIDVFSSEKRAVGTHNGFVDYFVMGGLPLLVAFCVLYGWITLKLWGMINSQSKQARQLVALAITLNLLFWAIVFFGDPATKYGWWLLGINILVISTFSAQKSPAPAPEIPHARRAVSSRA